MSIKERVWNALHYIKSRNVSPDDFGIHMGLGAWRALQREEGPADSLFGLEVKPNLNLADGEIILRFEVKA